VAEGIADGACQLALARDPGQGRLQPRLQPGEQRSRLVLADGPAHLRRAAADGGLDVIERAEALQRLAGERRAGGGMDVEELAPGMRPARHFDDGVVPVDHVEPRIAVGLQDAAETAEMVRRMGAAAVGTVAVEGRRRCRAAPGTVVTDIDPQPPGLGLGGARRPHRHGGVVAMDLVGGEDMGGNRLDQRPQLPGRLADPAGHRRAAELDAGPREDLGLAVERQVRAILVDQHMGEQAGTRPAAVDRQIGRRRLMDRLATPA
jgi:hypothetical protein